jgi:hypothetical protein
MQASGGQVVRVRIRRTRVLEDGLRTLNGHGENLKRKLHVEFINAQVVIVQVRSAEL